MVLDPKNRPLSSTIGKVVVETTNSLFFLKQLLVERVNDLLASFFHLKGRHVP